MTGFEAYKLWLAIQLHFTTDYNYFQYEGHTRVSKINFETRNDKYTFYRLARKYPTTLEQFYVAQFVYGDIRYTRELEEPTAAAHHNHYQKIHQSISKKFKDDVKFLLNKSGGDLNSFLFQYKNNKPIIFRYWLESFILSETLIILNELFNIFPKWNDVLKDNVLWQQKYSLIQNYTPWVEKYNMSNFKKILEEEQSEFNSIYG